MLYKPQPDPALSGICAMLNSWNAEADYFRVASNAARAGETPTAAVIAAAETAQAGLAGLLEDIDLALDAVPAGHPDFSELLRAQIAALALHESIELSLAVLDRFSGTASPLPTTIPHARPALAVAR